MFKKTVDRLEHAGRIYHIKVEFKLRNIYMVLHHSSFKKLGSEYHLIAGINWKKSRVQYSWLSKK